MLSHRTFDQYYSSCRRFRNTVTPFRWMVSTQTMGLVAACYGESCESCDYVFSFSCIQLLMHPSLFLDILESGFDTEAWGFGDVCCKQANTKQINLAFFTCKVIQCILVSQLLFVSLCIGPLSLIGIQFQEPVTVGTCLFLGRNT